MKRSQVLVELLLHCFPCWLAVSVLMKEIKIWEWATSKRLRYVTMLLYYGQSHRSWYLACRSNTTTAPWYLGSTSRAKLRYRLAYLGLFGTSPTLPPSWAALTFSPHLERYSSTWWLVSWYLVIASYCVSAPELSNPVTGQDSFEIRTAISLEYDLIQCGTRAEYKPIVVLHAEHIHQLSEDCSSVVLKTVLPSPFSFFRSIFCCSVLLLLHSYSRKIFVCTL